MRGEPKAESKKRRGTDSGKDVAILCNGANWKKLVPRGFSLALDYGFIATAEAGAALLPLELSLRAWRVSRCCVRHKQNSGKMALRTLSGLNTSIRVLP
jgi:hypothetical protein